MDTSAEEGENALVQVIVIGEVSVYPRPSIIGTAPGTDSAFRETEMARLDRASRLEERSNPSTGLDAGNRGVRGDAEAFATVKAQRERGVQAETETETEVNKRLSSVFRAAPQVCVEYTSNK